MLFLFNRLSCHHL